MKNNSKIRLLVCGDSLNQTTGFSYVISSIIKRLHTTGKYDIAYATLTGMDTTGEGLRAQGDDFASRMKQMKIYNVQVTDMQKAKQFDTHIQAFSPHIVLTSHDPWHVDMIAYSRYRDSFYWAAYMTVEVPRYPFEVMSSSPFLPTNRKPIQDIMRTADVVIPHTQMGYDMLTDHWKLSNVSDPCLSGVDFSKRCIRPVSKKEAFGDSVREDDFIFMSMGINSERKKLDRVIEAFHRFKQKHSNKRYKLYIHTDVSMPTGGTDLKSLVNELHLSDDVLIPKAFHAGMGIPKYELYKKYKASDCYIALPAGEGYGYGIAESMMHAKPVIYINYGGHTSYCAHAGIPVKVKEFTHARYAFMKWALADIEDAANAMSRIVRDAQLRKQLGRAGYTIARDQLDWNITFPAFEKALLSCYRVSGNTHLHGIPLRRVV